MAWMAPLVLLFFGILGLGAGLIIGGYLVGDRGFILIGVTAALFSTIPLFLSAYLAGSKPAQT